MDEKIFELVEYARKFDKNAFARLYVLTLQSAYYLALRMLKNEQDAMNIVQDSFVEAFCSLDKLKKSEMFESWIKHITASNCRDWIKENNGMLFSDDEQVFGRIEEDNTEFLPQELLEQKGSTRMITDIIDALPEAQRMIVMLHYYNEMPVSYIARFLSCSEGAIKSQLFRARAKIKAEVEARGINEVKHSGIGETPVLALLLHRAIKEQRIEAELYKEAFKEINRQVDLRKISLKNDSDMYSHDSVKNGPNTSNDDGGCSENATSGAHASLPYESAQSKSSVLPIFEASNKASTSPKESAPRRFSSDNAAGSAKKGLGIISKITAMPLKSRIILVSVSVVVVIAVFLGTYGISEAIDKRAQEADASALQEVGSFVIAETTVGTRTETSIASNSGAEKSDEEFIWTVSKVLNSYSSIEYFNEKTSVFKSVATGKYGLIDCKGKVVVEPNYEGFTRCSYGRDYYGYNDYHYCVSINGEDYEIDMNTYKFSTDWHGGHGVREDSYPPSGFNEVDRYYDGLAAAKKNGKWGYVDKSLKTVIPFEYDAVNSFDSYEYSSIDYCRGFDGDYVAVRKNGAMGIINKNNEVVVPFEYSVIMQGEDGIYLAKKSGNWGLIGVGGIKPIMPKIETTTKNMYLQYDGEWSAEIQTEFDKGDGELCTSMSYYQVNISKINGNSVTVSVYYLHEWWYNDDADLGDDHPIYDGKEYSFTTTGTIKDNVISYKYSEDNRGGAGSGKIILQGDSIVLSNTPATENGYMRFESIKLYQE